MIMIPSIWKFSFSFCGNKFCLSCYRNLRRELRNISNGDEDCHNFTEQNGINDKFLPDMVRAALTEQCRPEKGMQSQRSEDDVDKQAYQLGKEN